MFLWHCVWATASKAGNIRGQMLMMIIVARSQWCLHCWCLAGLICRSAGYTCQMRTSWWHTSSVQKMSIVIMIQPLVRHECQDNFCQFYIQLNAELQRTSLKDSASGNHKCRDIHSPVVKICQQKCPTCESVGENIIKIPNWLQLILWIFIQK